jgi:predicted nuclease of predicted toxin-antitoxin system
MADRWFFLIDECVDPDVAYQLDADTIRAEPVKDALWIGARDFRDILPYAREHDRILVTSNVTDFGGLSDEAHEGLVLLFDNEMEAQQIVAGLLTIVDRYPSRDELRGYEKLDPWVELRE